MAIETTTVDEMAVAISKCLDEYKDLAADEMKKAVRKAGKTVKADIKANAPRKSGRYKDSWKTKTLSENSSGLSLVIYSKDRYMLAHLLEKGHAKRGGGRVEGKPHIKPAEEKGIKQLEDDIAQALQRG